MLFLFPDDVGFGGAGWPGVTSVAIGRRAEKSIVEFGDGGSHVVLADVPEQRVEVTVSQELSAGDAGGPVPGEEGVLAFETGPTGSGVGRRRVSLAAVVLAVKYRVSKTHGASRVVELVGVSGDGVADPVVVEDV